MTDQEFIITTDIIIGNEVVEHREEQHTEIPAEALARFLREAKEELAWVILGEDAALRQADD